MSSGEAREPRFGDGAGSGCEGGGLPVCRSRRVRAVAYGLLIVSLLSASVAVAQLDATWARVALVAGLLLILLEPLIPTFGVESLLGAGLIVAALWHPFWAGTGSVWVVLVAALVAAACGIAGLVLIFRETGWLTLGHPGKPWPAAPEPPDWVAVGRVGTVRATLRPAGRVEFDGALVDARSDGQYVDVGRTVRVVRREGVHVVVEPAN